MKRSLFAIMLTILCCLSLALPASATPKSITVETNDQKFVRDTIAVMMIDNGFEMAQSNEYSLVFERDRSDSLGAIIFFGSDFNMSPRSRVTFNIIPVQGFIRVSCDGAMITNPGSAFESATTLDGDKADRQKIEMLYIAKGMVEGKDPKQLMTDAGIAFDKNDKAITPELPVILSGLTFDGFAIKTVEAGGIAEKAGLKPGDVIAEINGRPADEEMLRGIDARIADGRSVMIAYEREGNKDLATLKAE